MRVAPVLLLLSLSQPFYGQNGTNVPSSTAQDNAALTTMYSTDQKAREGNHIDWRQLARDDEQRRKDLR